MEVPGKPLSAASSPQLRSWIWVRDQVMIKRFLNLDITANTRCKAIDQVQMRQV